MNLAVNARDAMPDGGTLLIETSLVTLDDSYVAERPGVAPGRYVMLAVSDTGVGMDEEVRRRAFEPFFSTKDRSRSTGLGLATVYGIVKQSGGNIWLYSEPGEGTTFKVYLPALDVPASTWGLPGPQEAEQVRIVQDTTVLVVEDSDAVRRMTSRILARAGYSVLEARDGLEALTVADGYDGTIHLLLTDVVMPGPSGRRTADLLLKRRPQMRVVYMSGYTDNAIVHHGVLDADVCFIQKPFSAHDLYDALQRALEAGKQ